MYSSKGTDSNTGGVWLLLCSAFNPLYRRPAPAIEESFRIQVTSAVWGWRSLVNVTLAKQAGTGEGRRNRRRNFIKSSARIHLHGIPLWTPPSPPHSLLSPGSTLTSVYPVIMNRPLVDQEVAVKLLPFIESALRIVNDPKLLEALNALAGGAIGVCRLSFRAAAVFIECKQRGRRRSRSRKRGPQAWMQPRALAPALAPVTALRLPAGKSTRTVTIIPATIVGRGIRE